MDCSPSPVKSSEGGTAVCLCELHCALSVLHNQQMLKTSKSKCLPEPLKTSYYFQAGDQGKERARYMHWESQHFKFKTDYFEKLANAQ